MDESVFDGKTLQIKGQFAALYWEKFPLEFSFYVTASVLMPTGEHGVALEIVMATTHDTYVAAEDTVQQASPGRVRVGGYITASFKIPNFYYINIRVDGKRVATILLPVETSNTKFSYDLLPESKESIKRGEVFVLAKRPTSKLKA